MIKNVFWGVEYDQKVSPAWPGNFKIDCLQNEQIKSSIFCMLVQIQGS